ncbi:MAG: S41 family peptidase [Phycisphaerales bacterium]|nr:S41 family peptidase [Phycisphaerales bacterium]
MKTKLQSYTLRLILAAGLTSCVALTACSTNQEVVEKESSVQHHELARTISSEEALADFDAMWDIINETHFDPEFNGVDWDAVRDELRPQAADARNRSQLRGVMSDALGRFGQSHFGIIPSTSADPKASTSSESGSMGTPDNATSTTASTDSHRVVEEFEGYNEIEVVVPDHSETDGAGDADTGIDVRIIDGEAVVSAIRDQSPAQLAGVRTGWILNAARGHSVKARLDQLSKYVDENELEIHGVSTVKSTLQGPENTDIDLTFEKGDGSLIDLNIAREPMPGEFVKFGNLPPMSTHLKWEKVSNVDPSGNQTDIGLIAFNIWMIPIAPKFERAMYELRDTDGIIIDLRGNPGGVGALSSAISRFLVSEKGSLGTMTMRGTELKFNVEPVVVTTWGERLAPFTGPIAILTDAGSASTSEVFAGGLQSLGRVKVFGTRSAGMALPAGMDKLPSGDVLLHAIANYVTSTGQLLEHGGVIPDYKVELTRKDLLNGIDSPRDAAEKWIAESISE